MAAETDDRGKYVKGILYLFLGAALTVTLLAVIVFSVANYVGRYANIDFEVSEDVSSADVGLPAYPGAERFFGADGNTSAAHLRAMAGPAGFNVAVLKFYTPDTPARVAAFYRDALGRYGRVADCTGGVLGSAWIDELCEDHDPSDPDTVLLKAGYRAEQHIVSIEPAGGGSHFVLIYLQMNGFDF